MNDFSVEMQKIKKEYEAGERKRKTEALVKTFQSKPVILYGAGTLSSFVMSHLDYYGVSVTCFCDTYKSGTHKGTGLPIISLEQLNQDYRDAIVIVTSELHGASIMNTLQKAEYPGIIYTFDELLCFYTISYGDFEQHIEGYQWAYEHFSDDVSKQIVLDAIRTRLLGASMTPSVHPQYFEPDICPITDSEIFVDGGCFIGDTAEEFIRQTNGKYQQIYGFEPDVNNIKKAKANLKQYPNIEITWGGLSYITNTCRFMSGDFGGSKISEEGDTTIQTYALDEFFAGKPHPTFIKMDIEGAEFHALDGAKKILEASRPKLAICVYHKIEDMYTLPQQILTLNPKYKLTLRHYSHWYAESVCYAV